MLKKHQVKWYTMLHRKKLLVLTVVIPLLILSSTNHGLTYHNNNVLSIRSKQTVNSISGNVTIIIYNFEALYTDTQTSQIKNYVEQVLTQMYPACNFNVTILGSTLPNTFIFGNAFDQIMNSTHPEYVILMGGVSTGQSIFKEITNWMTGTNYTYVKQFALVDNMMTKQDIFDNNDPNIGIHFSTDQKVIHNLSLANIDFSQAGFMAGVQSALVTKNDKIGLIVDHTMHIDFTNKISSPFDQYGNPLFSFDRSNFIMGFIAGAEYSAEFLLKGATIDIKTVGYDFNNPNPVDVMNKNVQTLTDSGTDVIFNMESGQDSTFIQDANSLSIKTGVLGTNNQNATFSVIENSSLIVSNILQSWNQTSSSVDWTYNVANSSVMHLSVKPDPRLSLIKTELLNGSIVIPNYITENKIQGVSGFEFFFVFLTPAILVSKKKLIKL